MIDGKYEYFAFISYCWEDDKMAAELQKTLESYKFPTSLREKNPNLPSKIRPVFRDKTDLNGPRLEEALMTSLESSRYLIVICSPQAAKSNWVNRGIQRFIDLGREEDIIPFIIEGEANADAPQNECFPPALRSLKGERAIYGININDNGRDAAAVKVVSRMFDLKYDTLWNRFLLEQKKRRRYTIAGLVAAILIVAGVAGYIWTQNQELGRKNHQIQEQKTEIIKERDAAQKERDNAIREKNRAEEFSYRLTLANDSIIQAYEKLDLSERNLAKSNADLKESNTRLAQEMENVKKANWETQTNYAKLVAEKANRMMDEDCYVNARKELLALLPRDEMDKGKPLVPEVEQAFRRSFESESHRLDSTFIMKEEYAKVRFSTRKDIIAYIRGQEIGVLNALDGRVINRLNVTGFIRDVYFLDENKLAILESQSIDFLDLSSNKIVQTVSTDGDYRYHNRYGVITIKNASEDAPDKLVSIYNYDSKIAKHSFTIESTNRIQAAILIEDGFDQNVIIGFSDGTIAIYDAYDGKSKAEWKAHVDRVDNLDYNTSSGLLLSKSSTIGGNDSLKIWNIKTKKLVMQKDVEDYGSSAKFSKDGSLFILRKNNHFQLLSSYNGRIVKESNVSSYSKYFDISDDGESVAFINDKGLIHIWDIANFDVRSLKNLRGQEHIWGNAFSPDGRTCVVGMGNNLRFYEYQDDVREIKRVQICASEQAINSVKYSEDGTRVFVSSGTSSTSTKFTVWNTNSLTKEWESKYILPHEHFDVDVSGRYVLFHDWQLVCLFADQVLDYNKEIRHNSSINYAIFDPLTSNVVTAHDDGYIRFWKTENGDSLASFKVHDAPVKCVQFSKDGKMIVTASEDKRIKLWDRNCNKLIHVFEGHTSTISDVSFSFDGKYIVSTSYDQTTKNWDVESGDLFASYDGYGNKSSISPQNDYLLIMINPNQFKIKPIKTLQQLIEDAEQHFFKQHCKL